MVDWLIHAIGVFIGAIIYRQNKTPLMDLGTEMSDMRLNLHSIYSFAVFCLSKEKHHTQGILKGFGCFKFAIIQLHFIEYDYVTELCHGYV